VVGGAGDGVRSAVGTSTTSPGRDGVGVSTRSVVGDATTVGNAVGAMRAPAGDAVAEQASPPGGHGGAGSPHAAANAANAATIATIVADLSRRWSIMSRVIYSLIGKATSSRVLKIRLIDGYGSSIRI